MLEMTLQVKGMKLVSRGMQNLRTAVPRIAKLSIKDAGESIIKKMQRYPSPPPKSTYVRTYLFRNSWKIKAMPTGYAITNDARNKSGTYYGGFVVGDIYGMGQAWMHVGRWKLFNTVVMEVVDKLPKAILENIQTEARQSFEAVGI